MICIDFNDMLKENIKKQANQALKDRGFDELNRFLLVLIIIGLLIDIFFKLYIVGIIEVLLIIVFFYRLFLKNKYRNVKANRIYLEISGYIKNIFRKFRRGIKVKKNKNNVYKKCPKCGLILKLPLPKKRGIKHTTCPDCGTRFGFLALKIKKGSR